MSSFESAVLKNRYPLRVMGCTADTEYGWADVLNNGGAVVEGLTSGLNQVVEEPEGAP